MYNTHPCLPYLKKTRPQREKYVIFLQPATSPCSPIQGRRGFLQLPEASPSGGPTSDQNASSRPARLLDGVGGWVEGRIKGELGSVGYTLGMAPSQ